MRNLGVTLTEIADLEELAADCAEDGQYAFLYVAAPLKVAKGSRLAGQPRRHQVGAAVSAYDERPWLARYGDQPADYDDRVRQRPRRCSAPASRRTPTASR